MLLRFRVANHRSIKDAQELSLVAVPRRGEEPATDETSTPRAVKVAAIYGPNASGKSSVINAIEYFVNAIRHSYRRWDPEQPIPRQPFLLSAKSVQEPSFFELDFVFREIRFTYGFELDDNAIIGEWLYSYPFGKRRVLYERDIEFTDSDGFRFGRSLRGENSTIAKLTRDNALFLSVAASSSHPLLGPIYRYLTTSIVYADSTTSHESRRLAWLKSLLKNDEPFARDIADMMRLADLGLTNVRVVSDEPADQEIPASIRRVASRNREVQDALFEAEFRRSLRERRFVDSDRIELFHASEDSKQGIPIPLARESAGTRAWLSFAGRIIFALRNGEALIVDEIDASLHPRLSATLIQIFKDEEYNQRDAQLIFTSHDVSFLGSLVDDDLLSRDEVWFTEKDRTGATTLYSLEDFKIRPVENVERGYLQGRYGALPIIDIEQIKRVLARVIDRAAEVAD
ncbi:AAA family ATPase [Actinosynnema sp. NPDC004786]